MALVAVVALTVGVPALLIARAAQHHEAAASTVELPPSAVGVVGLAAALGLALAVLQLVASGRRSGQGGRSSRGR